MWPQFGAMKTFKTNFLMSGMEGRGKGREKERGGKERERGEGEKVRETIRTHIPCLFWAASKGQSL